MLVVILKEISYSNWGKSKHLVNHLESNSCVSKSNNGGGEKNENNSEQERREREHGRELCEIPGTLDNLQ